MARQMEQKSPSLPCLRSWALYENERDLGSGGGLPFWAAPCRSAKFMPWQKEREGVRRAHGVLAKCQWLLVVLLLGALGVGATGTIGRDTEDPSWTLASPTFLQADISRS